MLTTLEQQKIAEDRIVVFTSDHGDMMLSQGLTTPDAVQGRDVFGAAKSADAGAFISLPVPITEARRYGFAEYRGLRNERYTYVRSIHGPWLLYDNQRDPYQMHNLCGKPEEGKVQSAMERHLEARLRELKDDFLPAKEYIDRVGVGHYGEVTLPAGHMKSPWGDWESTLSS